MRKQYAEAHRPDTVHRTIPRTSRSAAPMSGITTANGTFRNTRRGREGDIAAFIVLGGWVFEA